MQKIGKLKFRRKAETLKQRKQLSRSQQISVNHQYDFGDALLRNDNLRTELRITLCHDDEEDVALANALDENYCATSLTWVLEGVKDATAWQRTLAAVARFQSAKSFGIGTLDSWTRESEPNRLVLNSSVVQAFLEAFKQNENIEEVVIEMIRFSRELSVCLMDDKNESGHFTSLTLDQVNQDSSTEERVQDARVFATVLQDNSRVHTLTLTELEHDFLNPVFAGLATKCSLSTLALERVEQSVMESIAPTLQSVLKNTTTIREFKIGAFLTKETFSLIVEALICSQSVTDIQFGGRRDVCAFGDEESAQLFQRLMRTKKNLRSLILKECRVVQSTRHMKLMDVEMSKYSNVGQELWPTFSLAPLTEIKLAHFKLKHEVDPVQFAKVTTILPTLKVRDLVLHVSPGLHEELDLKRDFVHSLEKNDYLQSVKVVAHLFEHDVLNEDEQEQIGRCMERNKGLSNEVQLGFLSKCMRSFWKSVFCEKDEFHNFPSASS